MEKLVQDGVLNENLKINQADFRLSHHINSPARMVPLMLCQAQLMAQGRTAKG